jgi:hypothetical protein
MYKGRAEKAKFEIRGQEDYGKLKAGEEEQQAGRQETRKEDHSEPPDPAQQVLSFVPSSSDRARCPVGGLK